MSKPHESPRNKMVVLRMTKLDSLMAFLRASKKTLLLIVVTALITLAISATISVWLSSISNLHIPSLGVLRTEGVEAYWDISLENKTEEIDWGTIWLGSSNDSTFYIQSIKNTETLLYLNTTNWKPADISNYMNFTWNYNGTTLQPGEIIQVTLTLSAPYSSSFIDYLTTNNVKNFTFDILISTSKYNS